MATLWYDGNGNLLALAQSDAEQSARFPNGYVGAAGSIIFDESTNASIIASLNGNVEGFRWQDHTVQNGQLLRDGQILAIAPDGQERIALQAILANAANEIAANTVFLALPNVANQQLVLQLQALTLQMNQVLARLILFGQSVV